MILTKGIPDEGRKIITKDPVTGKITGSQVIKFTDDEKVKEKVAEFTLTDVDSKDENISTKPVKKGRPAGIHTPISEEGKDAIRAGQKKKFRKDNYKDNPIVKLVDVTSLNMINRTYLKGEVNKLTMEDMEKISFGESVVYVIEYYAPKGLDAEHPLLILMAAMIGLGGRMVELKNKPLENKEVTL